MQHWGRSPALDAMGGGAGRTGRSATIGTEPPVAETIGDTSEFLGWMRRAGGIIPPSATNNCTPDLFGAVGQLLPYLSTMAKANLTHLQFTLRNLIGFPDHLAIKNKEN